MTTPGIPLFFTLDHLEFHFLHLRGCLRDFFFCWNSRIFLPSSLIFPTLLSETSWNSRILFHQPYRVTYRGFQTFLSELFWNSRIFFFFFEFHLFFFFFFFEGINLLSKGGGGYGYYQPNTEIAHTRIRHTACVLWYRYILKLLCPFLLPHKTLAQQAEHIGRLSTRSDVISAMFLQPASAIAMSNSSRSISSTLLTPASPWQRRNDGMFRKNRE